MAAWAGPGDDTDEEIRLCRIEYLGDDDWGFALYDPATETYEPAVLPGGQPFGSAVEAYDAPSLTRRNRVPRRFPGLSPLVMVSGEIRVKTSISTVGTITIALR
jgi:hypothetical protein